MAQFTTISLRAETKRRWERHKADREAYDEMFRRVLEELRGLREAQPDLPPGNPPERPPGRMTTISLDRDTKRLLEEWGRMNESFDALLTRLATEVEVRRAAIGAEPRIG